MNTSTDTQGKNNWKIWWNLCRPHTLTASFVPVFIGTAYALEEYGSDILNIPLFLAMMIASLLIQAATNMFNEYFDYKRGLDNAESVGIGGTIVREGVDAKVVKNLAFGAFGLALLLGIYICATTSWWVAVVGFICMLAAYFYSGGPYPIAYTPFGELAAGFFMGFVIILIASYIQIGEVTTEAMLISIPTSLFIGAINLANNIRDVDNDKENGRKTLSILVGKDNAIKVLAGMFLVAYIWTIGLVLFQVVTFWVLISILSVKKALEAVQAFIGKTTPIEMMPAMKFTAQTNTIFGFLFAIGLLIGYIFSIM